MNFTVAVLTVSDKGSAGLREDLSGPAVRALVGPKGGQVVASEIVPDEADQVAAWLRRWADDDRVDLVITTGGTGLSPRDITPEATKSVLDREAPGIAEAIRFESYKKVPMAMFSRAVAGIRGRTLIVNLPGSPRAVGECLEVLLPVLPHAIQTLRESVEHEAG